MACSTSVWTLDFGVFLLCVSYRFRCWIEVCEPLYLFTRG